MTSPRSLLLAGLLVMGACAPATRPIRTGPPATGTPPDLHVFLPDVPAPAEGVWNLAPADGRPAGADGWITVVDGHLSVGGQRIRLYGANLSGVPQEEDAAARAQGLAANGFNVVRYHLLDRPGRGGLHDDAALVRFDRFFAECKRRGIYQHLNWIAKAQLGTEDGFSAAVEQLDFKVNHVLFFFDRKARDWQRAYMTRILTHVNPHTGLAYKDDPALAVVETMNENGFLAAWHQGKVEQLPANHLEDLLGQWQAWLKAKGKAVPADLAIPASKRKKELDQGVLSDWLDFLYDTERDYYREMRECQAKLGGKALTMASISQMTPPGIAAEHDVCDLHEYWNHPHFAAKKTGPGGKPGDNMKANRWYIVDGTFVNGGWKKFRFMAPFRIRGKPQFVTEYNDCPSHPSSGPGLLIYAAYASLQDWDALYLFSASNANGRINSSWEVASHPAAQGHSRLASLIFRRGLIGPARKVLTIPFPRAEERARLVEGGAWHIAKTPGRGLPGALVHRCELDLTAKQPDAWLGDGRDDARAFTSDTGELSWNLDDGNASWIARAPTVRAWTGPAPATVALDGMQIEVEPTIDGEAAVALVLTAGTSLAAPERALLVATGRSQNTGERWGPYSGSDLPPPKDGHRRLTILDWGKAPVLAERIAGSITFQAVPGRTLTVRALDGHGKVVAEVPVTRARGVERFELGGAPTIAYDLAWE